MHLQAQQDTLREQAATAYLTVLQEVFSGTIDRAVLSGAEAGIKMRHLHLQAQQVTPREHAAAAYLVASREDKPSRVLSKSIQPQSIW